MPIPGAQTREACNQQFQESAEGFFFAGGLNEAAIAAEAEASG